MPRSMPFLDKKTTGPFSRPTLQLKSSFRCGLVRVMQFGTLTSLRFVQGVIWMMLDNFTTALSFLSVIQSVFRKINPPPSVIIIMKASDFNLCLMYTDVLASSSLVILGWLGLVCSEKKTSFLIQIRKKYKKNFLGSIFVVKDLH